MTDKRKPQIHRSQLPGIPGINSFGMYYGSWHLLNQAVSCFLNGENYSCLSCLNASVELWLKRKLKTNATFQVLIDKAKELDLITKKEQKNLHDLRKMRNDYLHFDINKLPKFKKWTKTFNPKKQEYAKTDLYPNDAFYDINPLSILPAYVYLKLNFLTNFYRKRYPKKGSTSDAYFRFTLTKIDGLDENEVFFKLGSPTPQKPIVTRFFSFLIRKLKRRT